MKTQLMIAALALVTTIGGCGKKKDGAGGGGGGDDKAAPSMTVNEADWVVKDMKDTSPMVHVSLKVPKDAKLEKNGNGGVDIRVSPTYVITVSNLAVSSIDEAKKSDKSLTVENKSYQNGKVLTDEPNGFVYTYQMKDEANGTKYQPESHFAYYLDKDGAFYSILDAKPLDAFDTPGSAYTTDIANKVYGIVKGSAKAN
jgi:hypothetical protein